MANTPSSAIQEPVSPKFPFETDPDDHCESPIEAYRDILPLLRLCGKSSTLPSIYDPYYCNGGVIDHLAKLGITQVYNRKEDCYKVWEAAPGSEKRSPEKIKQSKKKKESRSHYPDFDVMVTNPPYSGDHIEKLIHHLTTSSSPFGSRPWFLLLPQWVHKKDYYTQRTKSIRPFYMVPQKRYVYSPPPSFRESKKSDVHKKSSPFCSMWYIWGGSPEFNECLISKAYQVSSCNVARSKSALRDLRRKGDSTQQKQKQKRPHATSNSFSGQRPNKSNKRFKHSHHKPNNKA